MDGEAHEEFDDSVVLGGNPLVVGAHFDGETDVDSGSRRADRRRRSRRARDEPARLRHGRRRALRRSRDLPPEQRSPPAGHGWRWAHGSGDADLDGLSNGEEVDRYGTYPTDSDTDDDALDDGEEVGIHATDPLDPDTDDDRLRDGFEVQASFDPLVPGDDLADPDGDELNNFAEQSGGTDPRDPDSDGDGLPDGFERGRVRGLGYPAAAEVARGGEVTTADFDGDGDPDLVISTYGLILGYENRDGRGTFGKPMTLVEDSCYSTTEIVFGDMNRDGLPDIVRSCAGASSTRQSASRTPG